MVNILTFDSEYLISRQNYLSNQTRDQRTSGALEELITRERQSSRLLETQQSWPAPKSETEAKEQRQKLNTNAAQAPPESGAI